MILDAHQHFWYYNPIDYSWIDDRMQVLKRDFLPADLQVELTKSGITGTVAVQARQNLEETGWLLKLASKHPFITGVVGWVDLCSDQIEKQLQQFSSNPKFVGVRHVVHDEPDAYFMAREDFRRGISLLQKFNLSYDLLIFPLHLKLAADLVNTFPEQTFILDHIAKPDIKNKKLSNWKSGIEKLTSNRNVYCKLSGMVTEADWHNWQSQDFYPYLEWVFQCFGPNKLMIGSDWPVCTVAGNYNKIIHLVKEFAKQFDTETQHKIFAENCIRAYRLQVPVS